MALRRLMSFQLAVLFACDGGSKRKESAANHRALSINQSLTPWNQVAKSALHRFAQIANRHKPVCQISRTGVKPGLPDMVGLSRFELLTPRLSSVCSNQLSYRPSFSLEPHARSNPILKPLDCQRTDRTLGPIPSKLDRRAKPTNHLVTCQIDLRNPLREL